MLGFCLAWACVCFVNAGSLCEFICASALPYGEQSFTEVSLCFQLLQSSCLLFHPDASGLRGGFDEDIPVSWVFQCLFLFACCPVVGLCLSAQLRQEETSLARSEQDADLPPLLFEKEFFLCLKLDDDRVHLHWVLYWEELLPPLILCEYDFMNSGKPSRGHGMGTWFNGPRWFVTDSSSKESTSQPRLLIRPEILPPLALVDSEKPAFACVHRRKGLETKSVKVVVLPQTTSNLL